MPRIFAPVLMHCFWVLAIIFTSEFATVFDKTQLCLLGIMYWLITISFEICRSKE